MLEFIIGKQYLACHSDPSHLLDPSAQEGSLVPLEELRLSSHQEIGLYPQHPLVLDYESGLRLLAGYAHLALPAGRGYRAGVFAGNLIGWREGARWPKIEPPNLYWFEMDGARVVGLWRKGRGEFETQSHPFVIRRVGLQEEAPQRWIEEADFFTPGESALYVAAICSLRAKLRLVWHQRHDRIKDT